MKGFIISAVICLTFSACSREYDEDLRIVFQRQIGAYYQIMIMDDDGSNVIQLTDTPSNNQTPSWASDGESILFTSNRDGAYKIYIMNSDGTGVRKLSDQQAYYPTWSPDSARISFYFSDGDQEIFFISPHGTGLTQVTANAGIQDMFPVWFPDSTIVAFLRDYNIYTMKSDGTGIVQVTTAGGYNSLSVSPDGRRIAYESGNAIWVMNSDGTAPVNLSSPYTATACRPSWSPSGDRIVFATGNFPREICIINSGGTNFRYMTTNSMDEDSPCFQGKPK